MGRGSGATLPPPEQEVATPSVFRGWLRKPATQLRVPRERLYLFLGGCVDRLYVLGS